MMAVVNSVTTPAVLMRPIRLLGKPEVPIRTRADLGRSTAHRNRVKAPAPGSPPGVSGFAFEYFGLQVGVEWDDTDLDRSLWDLLLPIWRSEPSLRPSARFRVTRDSQGNLLVEGPPDEPYRGARLDVIETLERRLHFYLACLCREAVFVHAGVVGWGGGAVVIPGRSFSGKSTLTLALLEAGASYLSDEYAVIDRAGRVHPFPRPISLRGEKGQERRKVAQVCLRPLPLAAVVVTQFSENSKWEPETLSAGGCVLEMMANTVQAQTAPQLALHCLGAAVTRCVGWKGRRGEAAAAAAAILKQSGGGP